MMSNPIEIGKVEIKEIRKVGEKQLFDDGIQIEWKIPNFSLIADDEYSKTQHISPKFVFEGDEWCFQMCRLYVHKFQKTMYLYLGNTTERNYLTEYNFGFKKLDNSMEHIGNGVMEEKHTFSCIKDIFDPSEVMRRKAELLSSDVLTVVCILKKCVVKPSSIQPTASSTSDKNLIKLDTLSNNLRNLLDNKESCDITLHVKDKEYRAHEIILMVRSSVFAAMFLHETAEKQTGIITIPDCDPESFGEFLEFLYCGKLQELSYRSAFHLYETSDKYDVQELKTFCVECLKEKLALENFCDVVVLADKYDDTEILSAAQCFFNKNVKEILLTLEWDCLLKNDRRLANKLLIEMTSKMDVSD